MYCAECGKQLPDSAKFCSECGHNVLSESSTPEVPKPTSASTNTTIDPASFSEILQQCACYFDGKDSESINTKISSELGLKLKRVGAAVYSIFGSPDFLIVLPISKDKSPIGLAGLLLGGGALAAGAMAALESLAEKLHSRELDQIMGDDDPFGNAIIFPVKSLKFEAKEQRLQVSDFFELLKKETWIRVSGPAFYKTEIHDVGMSFGFEGQSSNSNKKVSPVFQRFFETIGVQPPRVHTGRNPPF